MKRRWWTPDVIWLAAVVLLASLHFWFPPVGEGTVHDTYSVTAEGKKAFYKLAEKTLKERGGVVVRNTEPLGRALGEIVSNGFSYRRTTFCLLGPERYPTQLEWESLLEFVEAGGSLVVAAREAKPELTVPEIGASVVEADVSGKVETTRSVRAGEKGFFWESAGRVESSGGETLVTAGGTAQAVLLHHGNGTIVVIATDSPFSNEAIADDDHSTAALAFKLVETPGRIDEIIFDESLNESGVPKAVGLLLHPPLRQVTVQILIALVIFAWWHSRRFGPLIPEAVRPRQNIVEHTNAAGQLFFRSKDGSAPLRAYLRQLILELRLKAFKNQENRVLEPIAIRLGEPVESVRRTLQEARRGAKTERLDRHIAGKLIRKLSFIREAARQRKLNGAKPA